MTNSVMLALALLGASAAGSADSATPSKDTVNCYLPVDGGWRIRITADPNGKVDAVKVGLSHEQAIARAMNSLRAATAKLKRDPNRPV